jgi:L-seryl-tRNA(Ser) seleniumtransferase
MDVYPDTWPARTLIDRGAIAGPPHHGIGRGFKVGKEEIAGLIAALRLYLDRDFAAERERLGDWAVTIADGLAGVRGLTARCVDHPATGRPGPQVVVHVDEALAGISAGELINRIQEGEPRVCTYEARARAGEIGILPDALAAGEAEEIIARIRAVIGA